jgi:hypothetical protein
VAYRLFGQLLIFGSAFIVIVLTFIDINFLLPGIVITLGAVVAAYPWFRLEQTLETHQSEIGELRSTVGQLQGDLLRINREVQGLETKQSRVEKSLRNETVCFLCLDDHELTQCEYCDHHYCGNDWSIHVLEYCEKHPDYDPDWEKKVEN